MHEGVYSIGSGKVLILGFPYVSSSQGKCPLAVMMYSNVRLVRTVSTVETDLQ